MPSPPDVRKDNFVDAVAMAGAGSSVDRTYTAADLPRLAHAGAAEGSEVHASLRFSLFDGQPAVKGRLNGQVVLTCQRCMKPVASDVDERFQVLIVPEERSDEPGGYEPVIANPTRLDLAWLVEDQVLLALPLVPMHPQDDCAEGKRDEVSEPAAEVGAQKPFENLRDMMRKR